MSIRKKADIRLWLLASAREKKTVNDNTTVPSNRHVCMRAQVTARKR